MNNNGLCPICNRKLSISIEFALNRKIKRDICPCHGDISALSEEFSITGNIYENPEFRR